MSSKPKKKVAGGRKRTQIGNNISVSYALPPDVVDNIERLSKILKKPRVFIVTVALRRFFKSQEDLLGKDGDDADTETTS